MILLSQACIPFLCFSANIRIATVCLQGYLERDHSSSVLVHRQTHAAGIVSSQVYPSPRGQGVFGRTWGSTGRRGNKAANTSSPDPHDWWLAAVRNRRNPWDMMKSLTRDEVLVVPPRSTEWGGWAGAEQKGAAKGKLLMCTARSSSDLKDNWNGLVWVE